MITIMRPVPSSGRGMGRQRAFVHLREPARIFGSKCGEYAGAIQVLLRASRSVKASHRAARTQTERAVAGYGIDQRSPGLSTAVEDTEHARLD